MKSWILGFLVAGCLGCSVAQAQTVSSDAGPVWPPPWPPTGVSVSTRPPTGQGVEILRQRVTGELGSLQAAWLSAWQRAGLRLVRTQDRESHRSAVFDAPDGTRVFTTLQGDFGYGPQAVSWRYSLSTSRPVPPGRCIVPPTVEYRVNVNAHGVDQQGETHFNTVPWILRTTDGIDVDGDGELDTFVPVPGSTVCPEDTLWDVYVRRGNCGHRLGRVGPGTLPGMAEVMSTPLDASGFRPLAIPSTHSHTGARGIPEQITVTRRFEFRAGAYVQTRETRRGGTCHHCSTWSCTRVTSTGTP